MRRLLSALALALCLALPATASATYEEIGSGQTKLTLEQSFLSLLKNEGVTLKAVAPAKLKGATATFPVSGGKLDPVSEVGFIDHEGALLFKAAGRSIPIKALMLKTTQRRAPLSAKVGGGQLKLGTAKKLAVSPAGFASKAKVSTLALSAKVAGRLAKKLRAPGIEAGLAFATTTATAMPRALALRESGRLSFVPDPALRAKLDSLFVAWNPVFPAERPGAEFTFPIVGGTLAPNASSGTVEAEGSLDALQLGGGQVFWRSPRLDFAAGTLTAELETRPSPPYAGVLGRVEIGTLSLIGASVTPNPKARSVSVQNATLGLSAVAATAFNEAFAGGKAVFAAGERLGGASFVAVGE